MPHVHDHAHAMPHVHDHAHAMPHVHDHAHAMPHAHAHTHAMDHQHSHAHDLQGHTHVTTAASLVHQHTQPNHQHDIGHSHGATGGAASGTTLFQNGTGATAVLTLDTHTHNTTALPGGSASGLAAPATNNNNAPASDLVSTGPTPNATNPLATSITNNLANPSTTNTASDSTGTGTANTSPDSTTPPTGVNGANTANENTAPATGPNGANTGTENTAQPTGVNGGLTGQATNIGPSPTRTDPDGTAASQSTTSSALSGTQAITPPLLATIWIYRKQV